MWFQPAVCYLSGEQKVHRSAQRCQRFPRLCARGSAAASACCGLCGEKGKVLLQVCFQMYKPLPRCYLQVLTPLGKMVTPSLGLLLLTGYISNIKKKPPYLMLLPLPKNITLSKWNFLLMWASHHRNSTIHLWCAGIRRYNLWTSLKEPCLIPLPKREVHLPCIHGIYFSMVHMCGLYVRSLYSELLHLHLVNKYKYAANMKLYTCKYSIYSCPEGRLYNANVIQK